MLLEILDRLLQFIGGEVLERIINRISQTLTQIVVYTHLYFKSRKTYFSLPQVALLYRSENFLVIDKPPDLLINSNDPAKASVQTVLRKQFPELPNANLTHEFYFAHRLDYSTSGILCLPLNKKACSALCSSFEGRKSKKFYIALVNGTVSQHMSTIEDPIGDDIRFESTNKKMCTASQMEFCKNPRRCVTHICVVDTGYYLNRPATKVILMAVTGRRHQLRVHCRSIGHPIVGDFTYGTEMDKYLPRMFLHAIRLAVPNDVEGIQIETQDPFQANRLENWHPNSTESKDLHTFYELLEKRAQNYLPIK